MYGASAFKVSVAALSIATVALPASPAMLRHSAFGATVVIRSTVVPSGFSGPADPGPHVGVATMTIVDGPLHVRSDFDLRSLVIVKSRQDWLFSSGKRDLCDLGDIVAIERRRGWVAPTVRVRALLVGKGCSAFEFVFVPRNSRSRTYVSRVQL